MRRRKNKPGVKPKPKLTRNDIDFFTAGDIAQDIDRIDRILRSGIFDSDQALNPLVKSAFTELVICLYDLLVSVEKYGSRLSFTEDIVATPEVSDITDLVQFVRDSICHIHIPSHFVVPKLIKASFFTFYGRGAHIPFEPDHGIVLVSDYADDVCFFFGLQKIYLKRHVIRAFGEAQHQLLPLPEFPNDILMYGPPNSE